MLGTDWSNFQPIPMLADSQALLAAGFTFAIVGLQHEPTCEAQVAALRAGGIVVEDCYIENTLNPPIPAGMKRGWVAVEDGSGFTDQVSVDAQLAYLTGQGLEAGVYSSRYMLAKYPLTLNCPLWLADYDGVAGPLAGAVMKQYSGTGLIPGLAYELDLDWKADAPQEVGDVQTTDDPVTDEDKAVVETLLARGKGSLKHVEPDPTNPAQTRYVLYFVQADIDALKAGG